MDSAHLPIIYLVLPTSVGRLNFALDSRLFVCLPFHYKYLIQQYVFCFHEMNKSLSYIVFTL